MKAVLKRLHSPDVFDLESHEPEDRTSFSLLVQAMIGPVGQEGEESFDIDVCTPRWLDSIMDAKSVVFGRHYIIVKAYDYHLIHSSIEQYVDTCSGKDWEEVAERLSRLGKWEFEDYAP